MYSITILKKCPNVEMNSSGFRSLSCDAYKPSKIAIRVSTSKHSSFLLMSPPPANKTLNDSNTGQLVKGELRQTKHSMLTIHV